MLHKKNCKYSKCKKEFFSVDNRRIYCSRLCSNNDTKLFGEKNPKAKKRKWHKNKTGYIIRYENNKLIFKHRVIMERHVGRKLKRSEVVHHINGKRDDNRLENLMLFPNNKAHLNYHRKNKFRVNQYK